MIYILVAIILFLMLIPIIIVILSSFTSESYFSWPIKDFSLIWYQRFFEQPEWFQSFLRSLLVAFTTIIITLVLATLASLALQKSNLRCKRFFTSVILSPLLVPAIIIAIALYYSFSHMELTNTLFSIIIGHSILALPIAFIIISAGLSQINQSLEMAALSLGATPIQVLFNVILPNLKSSIFAAAISTFVASMDEVLVTLYLSGLSTRTLPIVMWSTMRSNTSPIVAVASTLLIATIILIFIFALFFKGLRKIIIAFREYTHQKERK